MDEIKVQVEPHWLPPYRLEYDGKYITLFGKDKNYPIPDYFNSGENMGFEEMVLVPCVEEVRKARPIIKSFDDNEVVIELNLSKQ